MKNKDRLVKILSSTLDSYLNGNCNTGGLCSHIADWCHNTDNFELANLFLEIEQDYNATFIDPAMAEFSKMENLAQQGMHE